MSWIDLVESREPHGKIAFGRQFSWGKGRTCNGMQELVLVVVVAGEWKASPSLPPYPTMQFRSTRNLQTIHWKHGVCALW